MRWNRPGQWAPGFYRALGARYFAPRCPSYDGIYRRILFLTEHPPTSFLLLIAPSTFKDKPKRPATKLKLAVAVVPRSFHCRCRIASAAEKKHDKNTPPTHHPHPTSAAPSPKAGGDRKAMANINPRIYTLVHPRGQAERSNGTRRVSQETAAEPSRGASQVKARQGVGRRMARWERPGFGRTNEVELQVIFYCNAWSAFISIAKSAQR
ncbi:hypothetical protein RB601_002369 [Gaeumannomyces tritici]